MSPSPWSWSTHQKSLDVAVEAGYVTELVLSIMETPQIYILDDGIRKGSIVRDFLLFLPACPFD